MVFKFFFAQLSIPRQVSFMKKRGIVLGTRWKNGRQAYIYMFHDLFAEVLYKDDNPEEPAERVMLVSGIENLTEHLEKETKSGS